MLRFGWMLALALATTTFSKGAFADDEPCGPAQGSSTHCFVNGDGSVTIVAPRFLLDGEMLPFAVYLRTAYHEEARWVEGKQSVRGICKHFGFVRAVRWTADATVAGTSLVLLEADGDLVDASNELGYSQPYAGGNMAMTFTPFPITKITCSSR